MKHSAPTLPLYVIVTIQENRTVDNFPQTQPGVDTQNYGYDSHHKRVMLAETDLGGRYSCSHSHSAFVKAATQGFDVENCGEAPPSHTPT